MQMDVQSFARLGLTAAGAAQTILLQTSEHHPYAIASGGFLAMVGSINYLRRQSFARSWKKQLAGLDPKKAEDTDIIIKRVVGHSHPFEMFLALNFCFYRTFCSPTIAGVYRNTGTIIETTNKRALDTDLLMHIWMDFGLDSKLGSTSVQHLNKIHGLHATKTRNVDFVFVLCCLVVDAIQFCNDYGSAKITSKEEQAIWEFYHRVGVRMELADIPDNLEKCYTFVESYTEDDKSAKVTKDGQALTASITKLVGEWYYLVPKPLVRMGVSVILYQMGGTFHRKLGMKKPSAIELGIINVALWLRKSLLNFLPPRTVPYKLSDVIMASSYGCPVSNEAIRRVGPVDMLAKIEANELKEE